MIEFLLKGGFVMWPIAVLAFVSLSIIIERAVYFYITGIDYNHFRSVLLEKIKNQDLETIDMHAGNNKENGRGGIKLFQSIQKNQWNRNQFVRITLTYLKNIRTGTRSREEALRRVGSEEIEKMERNFKVLSAISHISPLLGLLGTVTGIIGAFSVIAEMGGQVDVTALAGGIWEAMLTTAAGLIVAIPTQLIYLYYEKVVSARVNRMSYTITYLNEELFKDAGCENDTIPLEAPSAGDQLIYHKETDEEI
jgi:biopolymer transport protein ExbB